MHIKESEAFILRTFKLAEADKIVVCLTRDFGVIRGVAKGARRLKSRFGASLEPFTYVHLTFFEKEGRELVTIQQADILHSYFHLSWREEAVTALDYLSELALEFAPPNQADEKFFRMICACFSAIKEDPESLSGVVQYFEIWTLKLTGFLPDLKRCGKCGEDLLRREGQRVFFNADFSLRCQNCRNDFDQILRQPLYALLRASSRMTPKSWALEKSYQTKNTIELLASLTRRLIEHHLERSPRSFPATKNIGDRSS